MSEQFRNIGIENNKRYKKEFRFTDSQTERFQTFFKIVNDTWIKHDKMETRGNINRLGLICTRVAMLLTYLRNFNDISIIDENKENKSPSISGEIICNEIDFDIAIALTQKMISHLLILDDLYQKKNPKQTGSFLIHTNNNKYSPDIKKEAINLRQSGLSYSQIAEKLLNDPKLKATIQKWVTKSNSFPVSVSETETNTGQTIEVIKVLKSTTVSFYDHVMRPKPTEEYNLYNLLTCDDFKEMVYEVRAAKGTKQKEIKLNLPAFSPSGIFSNARKKENLGKHSGFLCIDIDKQDNLHIENFSTLKKELSKIVNVAFVGNSVSGKGYYLLIPIDNPKHHEEYFNAIEKVFSSWGIVIDKSCKDVSRLRIVSYDEHYYLAEKAVVFNSLVKQKLDITSFDFVDNERFTNTIKAIEQQKIDITNNYNDWFSIGCAIANTFGDKGRNYFHKVSKFHAKYSETETNEQYSACLKNSKSNGYSLGTFFYLVYQHGVIV